MTRMALSSCIENASDILDDFAACVAVCPKHIRTMVCLLVCQPWHRFAIQRRLMEYEASFIIMCGTFCSVSGYRRNMLY